MISKEEKGNISEFLSLFVELEEKIQDYFSKLREISLELEEVIEGDNHLNGIAVKNILSDRLGSFVTFSDIEETTIIKGIRELGHEIKKIEEETRKYKSEEKRLQDLIETTRMLYTECDPDRLIELIMDIAVSFTKAERGFLILKDSKGKMEIKVARNLVKKDMEGEDFNISKRVIDEVAECGRTVLLKDASNDSRFSRFSSVIQLHLRSILAVPLTWDNTINGVIYLDNTKISNIFTDQDSRMLEILAKQMSAALKNAHLIMELERSSSELKKEIKERYDFSGIVTSSEKMLRVLQITGAVAATDVPVLIQGESGTGKELIAKAIHTNSERFGNAFICINCAAIPEGLLEAELFGYQRGAFTGAVKDRRGKLVQADGGTLFLDEIGELSSNLQAKLLRVIQEKQVDPVGAEKPVSTDFRLISATNRDIEEMMNKGEFREDLFYRISVIHLKIPSLKERREDIPLIINYFLEKFPKELNKTAVSLQKDAEMALRAYDYPGNVRELENILKRAIILCSDGFITLQNLPEKFHAYAVGELKDVSKLSSDLKKAKKIARERASSEVERLFVMEALENASGNISKASNEIHMDRRQFYRLMKKYKLKKEDF